MKFPFSRTFFAFGLLAAILAILLVLHHYRTSTNFFDAQSDDIFITDCITKKVLGRIPSNMEVLPFTDQVDGFEETGEQRVASFQKVFRVKEWVAEGGDPNVVSGHGSTLMYSQEAIAGLHTIISDIKRTSGLSRVRLLDIPCGDMTWMSRFLKTRDDIDYTGYDIVPELIAAHSRAFENHTWKFFQHDIVENPIEGTFDLIFSRMMLQHLVTSDVLKVLKRFSDSGSKYLLTTTFPRTEVNVDLNTSSVGRFRYLNLEIPPISLTPPKCIFRDGEEDTWEGSVHFLALWKLPLYRVNSCAGNIVFKMTDRDFNINSCTDWKLNK